MMNHHRPTLFLLPLLIASATQLAAADGSISIAPQIMVGTPGLEVGVAGEFRLGMSDGIMVRPEVFLNNDGKLGAGGALLWSLGGTFDLPARQDVSVGPRLAYHNTDDEGLEVSAMGIWSFVLGDQAASPHSIEAIAAVGILQDRDHDDVDLAAAAGAAYAYRF